jgi:hypothetical protein
MMSIDNDALATILGIGNILGSLVLFCTAAKTTRNANWRTAQGLWAYGRRAVYYMATVALYAIGLKYVHHETGFDFCMFCFFSMLVFSIIIFPLLRAIGLTVPDHYVTEENSKTLRPARVKR